MKKLFFSVLFLSFIATGASAQFNNYLKNFPGILRIVHKSAYRKVYAKINQVEKEKLYQSKKTVKLPETIFTLSWDTAAKQWGDTTEKITIGWDNNNNLQSITYYNRDTAAGDEVKTIESGFSKINTPTDLDDNVSINYYPSVVTSQNMVNGQWVNDSKQLISFDKNGVITSAVQQQWSKTKWNDYMKFAFVNDSKGNFIELDVYNNTGGNWVMAESIKEALTFNNDGFITEVLQTVSLGGAFFNNIKENYVLDSKGLITSALVCSFDQSTSAWVKSDSFSDIKWLKFDPKMQINYATGGTQGALAVGGDKYSSCVSTSYDDATQSWGIKNRKIYSYNSDSLVVSVLAQNENNKVWENYTSDTTTYYTAGDVKTFLSRYWSSGWNNTSAGKNNINSYDGDNDITENIVQNQDPAFADKFINSTKTEYLYEHNSAIDQPLMLNNAVNLFPNPAADQLNISFNAKPGAQYSISISDLNGKTVYSKTCPENEANVKVDVSDLKSGIYFLSLNNGASVSNYKFIKN